MSESSLPQCEVSGGVDSAAYKALENCPICYHFITEPVFDGSGCGALVCCASCFRRMVERANTLIKCPMCRKPFHSRTVLSPIEKESFKSILLKCTKCNKTGIQIWDWRNHCDNECGNRCQNKGCKQMLFSNTQEEHNRNCNYIETSCIEEKEGCQWKGPRKDIPMHIQTECSYHMMVKLEAQFEQHAKKIQEYREKQAMRIVGKEKRLETAHLFEGVMYSDIKDKEHHEIKAYEYNASTKEFTFETVDGFRYTVQHGDERLVHSIQPNPEAKRWQDLVCKLYWVPARTKEPEQLVQQYYQPPQQLFGPPDHDLPGHYQHARNRGLGDTIFLPSGFTSNNNNNARGLGRAFSASLTEPINPDQYPQLTQRVRALVRDEEPDDIYE